MKAILVIDMPKSCWECDLRAKDSDGDNYCCALREYEFIDDDDIKNKRKYWRCPLKKIVGVFE